MRPYWMLLQAGWAKVGQEEQEPAQVHSAPRGCRKPLGCWARWDVPTENGSHSGPRVADARPTLSMSAAKKTIKSPETAKQGNHGVDVLIRQAPGIIVAMRRQGHISRFSKKGQNEGPLGPFGLRQSNN